MCGRIDLPATILVISLLLVAGPVRADLWVDVNESLFGPTNVNGAIGNGGLTVGISERGDLTVFRWPTPSIHDQLFYRASDRNAERMGADVRHGSFSGVRVGGEIFWLRDAGWDTQQAYLTEDDNILVTRFHSAALGITVQQLDAVEPEGDFLLRRYTIDGMASDDEVSLVFYENFAPCVEHLEGFPTRDWFDDQDNDYLSLYSSEHQAVLHFRPSGSGIPSADEFLDGIDTSDPAAVDGVIASLDGRLADGVFLAIGGLAAPDRFNVGQDSSAIGSSQTDSFTAVELGTHGSLAGAGAANAYLEFPFRKAAGGTYQPVNIVIAAGETAGASLGLLAAARRTGPEAVIEATKQWWRDWIGRADLSLFDDPEYRAVLKRLLISIRTAFDPASGAVVASITTQPPYAQDWTRDGAFLNVALDLAGYHDMVAAHNRFYMRVQHQEDLYSSGFAGSRGTWGANFYSDGIEGFPPFLFELDATTWAVWALAAHAFFIEDRSVRRAYLEEVYPSIRLGVEALLPCRDPKTGIECEYFIEGNPPGQGQDLYGALMLWLALDTGRDVAVALDRDDVLVGRLEARMAELEAGILDVFGDGQGGLDQYSASMVWPVNFLSLDDPSMMKAAEALESYVTRFVHKEIEEGLLVGWGTLALARLISRNPGLQERVESAIDAIIHDVPTVGTRHFGESWYVTDRDGDGDKDYWMRVSLPNLWQPANVYLTIMALQKPELFDRIDSGDFDLEEEPGCSCRIAPHVPDTAAPWDLLLPALSIAFFRLRTRISHQPRR